MKQLAGALNSVYHINKNHHAVISSEAPYHAFKVGAVVRILSVSRGTIAGTRRTFLIYEVLGKNVVSGKLTRQRILDRNIRTTKRAHR